MTVDRTDEFVARIAYNIVDKPFAEKHEILSKYPAPIQQAVWNAIGTLRKRRSSKEVTDGS